MAKRCKHREAYIEQQERMGLQAYTASRATTVQKLA